MPAAKVQPVKNVMTPGFIPRTVNNQPTAEGFAPLASRGWLGQM